MVKFRNEHDDVIETEDPATILNYRSRPEFTEVEESETKSRKRSKSAEAEESTE